MSSFAVIYLFLLMLSLVPFAILYACVIVHISGLIEKKKIRVGIDKLGIV